MLTFDAFFDHLGDADWVAIIVATLATMVLAYLWYSPLFGKIWSAETGIPNDPDPVKVAWTGVTLFLFNIGLSFFIADDLEHVLVLGLIFGVLMIAMALYQGVIWAGYSMKAFTVDATYWIAAVIVGAVVQGMLF